MPIKSQSKKAIGLNKAGWRSQKHLLNYARNNQKRPGVTFLKSLDEACRLGWLESNKPDWERTVYYFRLTSKGRDYLKKKNYKLVTEAFKLPEAVKLSATRAKRQLRGWYSIKHTGVIDDKLIADGIYESAVVPRLKKNGTYYRLTPKGRKQAKIKMRKDMESELRSEFRDLRQYHEGKLKDKLKSPAEVVRAFSDSKY
jgi:DNA-binding PadR family transcriptional regulator